MTGKRRTWAKVI